MKITRYTRSRSLIFSILFFRIAQDIFATVTRTLRTNEIRHLKIEKKSVILKCSSFVEFKKGFELWDRESVKQDPFSPPLFALFRDLAGREELYIPYLQHFEPSLLSVNWFQTLSPNGISGISIRSHLVKPGHKTRGPVCVTSIRTYIVVTCWRIRINLCDLHSLRIAINFSDLRLLLFPRFDIYSRRCGIALSVGSTPSSRILIGKILFSDLLAILN